MPGYSKVKGREHWVMKAMTPYKLSEVAVG